MVSTDVRYKAKSLPIKERPKIKECPPSLWCPKYRSIRKRCTCKGKLDDMDIVTICRKYNKNTGKQHEQRPLSLKVNIPKKLIKDILNDLSKDLPENLTKDVLKDILGKTLEKILKNTSQKTLKKTLEKIIKNAPRGNELHHNWRCAISDSSRDECECWCEGNLHGTGIVY